MKKSTLIVAALLLSFSLWAQKVIVIPTITPPYIPYPTQYLLPENQGKFSFQIISLSGQTQNVYFTFDLTSDVGVSVRFRDGFKPRKTYALLPNETKFFTENDIRGYAAAADFVATGINKTDLIIGKPLPTGNYQACFKVFDATTNELISSPSGGCSQNVLLAALDAPMLTLPLSNTEITGLQPQNLNFQWLKPAQAMPDIDYQFVMKKVPKGLTAQIVMSNNAYPTAYTETVSMFSQFIFGADKPALEIGEEYAWRVRAVDTKKRYLFANDGWSDIFSFRYLKPRTPMLAPSLVLPKNGDSIGKIDVPFSWSVPIQDPDVTYRLDLKRVPEGKKAEEVLDNRTEPVIFSKILRGPDDASANLTDLLPKLHFGSTYAWRVTALDVKNTYLLLNDGKSQTFAFKNNSPRSIRFKNPVLEAPIPKEKRVSGVKMEEVPVVTERYFFFKWASALSDSSFFGGKADESTIIAAQNCLNYELIVKKEDIGYFDPSDQMYTGDQLLHKKVKVPQYAMPKIGSVKYQYAPSDKPMEDQKKYVWYVRAILTLPTGDVQEKLSTQAEEFKMRLDPSADTSKGVLSKRIDDAFLADKKTDVSLNCEACGFKIDTSWANLKLETLSVDSFFYLGTMRLKITKLMTAQERLDFSAGFGANNIANKEAKIADKDLIAQTAVDSSEYKKAAKVFRGEGIAFLPWRKMPVMVFFDDVKVVSVNGKMQALEGKATASKEPAFSGGLNEVLSALDLDNARSAMQKNIQTVTALLASPVDENSKNIRAMTLPLGIEIPFSKDDDGSASLMFSDLRMTASQATMSVVAVLDLQKGPESTLALGATKCITADSFCGGNLRLFLANEKKDINMGGGHTLSILGDPAGRSLNSTFIDFVKNDSSRLKMSIQRLHLAAKYTPGDAMIEAVDDMSSLKETKPVGVTLNVDVNGLKNWMFRIDVPRFCFKSNKDFSFQLKDAVLDLSSKEKFAAMMFPKGYFDVAPQDTGVTRDRSNATTTAPTDLTVKKPDPELEWMGFYCGGGKVFLHNFGSDPKLPLSIELNQIIIDKSGLTTQLEANNLPFQVKVGASNLSLDTVRLMFQRSFIPRKFYMAGGLTIPALDGEIGCSVMWAKTDANNNVAWRVAVSVRDTLIYNLKLGSEGSQHFAKIALAPNSKIELQVFKDDISPQKPEGVTRFGLLAELNGWVNISIPESDATPACDLPALTVERLTFLYTKKTLNVSGYFGIAGFSVFSGAKNFKKSDPSVKTVNAANNATQTPPATTPPPATTTTATTTTTTTDDTRKRSNAVSEKLPAADPKKKNEGALSGLRISLDPVRPPTMVQSGELVTLEVGVLAQFGSDTNATALMGRVGINSQISYSADGFDIKYKSLSSIELGFDGTIKEVVKLKATLKAFFAHPVYGRGFSGDAVGTFKLGKAAVQIDAGLKIGRTKYRSSDDYDYFYGSLGVKSSMGIPMGPVTLYGLGGGFFNNMVDTIIKTTSKDSTLEYYPRKESIGFKVYPTIGLPKAETFNATITANFVFNKQGGFKLGLMGDGYMMVKSFPLNDKPTGRIVLTATLDDNGWTVNGRASFIQKPLEFTAAMYFHTRPDNKWRFKIGDPYVEGDRVTLKFNNNITANAYFAGGNDWENNRLPPIPAQVLKFINGSGGENSISQTDINTARGSSGLGDDLGGLSGKQFKVGAKVDIKANGNVACIGYYLNAVAGFDFTFTQSDKSFRCGNTKEAGINNWYANGQLYAYLKLTGTVKVDVGFWSGEKEFADIEGGAMMNMGFPNPFWVRGTARIKGSVLGVDFNENVPIEVGEVCEAAVTLPFVQTKIIKDMTPGNGSVELDPLAPAYVLFSDPSVYSTIKRSETSIKADYPESIGIYDKRQRRTRTFVFLNTQFDYTINGKVVKTTEQSLKVWGGSNNGFEPTELMPSEATGKLTTLVRVMESEKKRESYGTPINFYDPTTSDGDRKPFYDTLVHTFKVKKYNVAEPLSSEQVSYSWPLSGSFYQPYQIGNTGILAFKNDYAPFKWVIKNGLNKDQYSVGIVELDPKENGNKTMGDTLFAKCTVKDMRSVVFDAKTLKKNAYYVLQFYYLNGTKREVLHEYAFRTGNFPTYEEKFKSWDLEKNVKAASFGSVTKDVEPLSRAEETVVSFTNHGGVNTGTGTDPTRYSYHLKYANDKKLATNAFYPFTIRSTDFRMDIDPSDASQREYMRRFGSGKYLYTQIKNTVELDFRYETYHNLEKAINAYRWGNRKEYVPPQIDYQPLTIRPVFGVKPSTTFKERAKIGITYKQGTVPNGTATLFMPMD